MEKKFCNVDTPRVSGSFFHPFFGVTFTLRRRCNFFFIVGYLSWLSILLQYSVMKWNPLLSATRLHLWHKSCILYQRAVKDLYNSSLNFPFFYFSYLFGFSSKLSSELFISLTVQFLSTIILIIFWDFLMFCQVFLSPQVKRSAIITLQFQIIVSPAY